MSTIELTGLRADLPIGAMAAFGTLRVCQRLPGLAGTRLAWRDGYAVLHIATEMSGDRLAEMLVADVRSSGERPELTWSDQIKTVAPEKFRQQACEVMELRPEAVEWFAAFASDQVERDEKIIATPFDMSVARQRFLADALKLADGFASGRGAQTAIEDYKEALFGPWKYKDDQHSLGWDPSTMKLGAFTYKAPTALANAGVRAAVWLAFESLPLFPCFCVSGRLGVRAFESDGRGYAFRWPTWNGAISLDTLRSLLGWTGLTGEPSAEKLAARGITAIYRSERFKPNKYLSSFRAAELVWAAA